MPTRSGFAQMRKQGTIDTLAMSSPANRKDKVAMATPDGDF